MQLGNVMEEWQTIAAISAAGVMLFLFTVMHQLSRGERADGVPSDEIGVAPANIRRDDENALPPAQPYLPAQWSVLVDTAWDGRLSDQDLLYLEAVLRDEGIAARFESRRPTRQFLGFIGPQYPTRFVVDAARCDEAQTVRDDLFGQGWQNWQPRMSSSLVDVPGTRERLFIVGAIVTTAKDPRAPVWQRVVCVWLIIVILSGLVSI